MNARQMRSVLVLSVVGVTAALPLAGCWWETKPPKLAEDLVVSIGNEEWPPRLRSRFPVGTPEAKLLDVLGAEGFAIDRAGRTAKADWVQGICNHEVTVVWQVTPDSRLADIDGLYFPACP